MRTVPNILTLLLVWAVVSLLHVMDKYCHYCHELISKLYFLHIHVIDSRQLKDSGVYDMYIICQVSIVSVTASGCQLQCEWRSCCFHHHCALATASEAGSWNAKARSCTHASRADAVSYCPKGIVINRNSVVILCLTLPPSFSLCRTYIYASHYGSFVLYRG